MAKKDKTLWVSFYLRAGLALVFFYAGIASLLDPISWVGFVPIFLKTIFGGFFLIIFSVYEIVLGFWLLSGKKVFYSSLLSVLTMALIIIVNITVLDVVFRDIAILFMALALIALNKK